MTLLVPVLNAARPYMVCPEGVMRTAQRVVLKTLVVAINPFKEYMMFPSRDSVCIQRQSFYSTFLFVRDTVHIC